MYYRIKSRRVVLENTIQQPLSFCNFINEDRLLLLFKGGQFLIVNPQLHASQRIVYQDSLQIEATIVDCKRIKTNVCAVLTKNVSTIIFVRYVDDAETIVGAIRINEMEVLRHLQANNRLMVFNKNQFVIHSESHEYKTSYFTICRETKHQFNYDINSKSYPFPINHQSLIIKPLPVTSEIACYRQRDVKADRKIELIRLSQQLENQQLEVGEILSEEDTISQFIANSEHEYGLLVLRPTVGGVVEGVEGFKVMIYDCKVTNVYGKYSTAFQLRHNLNTGYSPFVSIIDFNYPAQYFLSSNHAQITLNGQIYDNWLQVRNLQTYEVIDKVGCNLKEVDTSPSKLCLVDYSQQIETADSIVLHLRNLFSKQYLYTFLLNGWTLTQQPTLKNIHSQIIQLL